MSSLPDTLKSLGPARLSILGAVFLGLIMFFIFVSAQVSKPNLSLLYGDLSTIDASSVAAKLQENSIVYEVSKDGTRVMVADSDIGKARMLLAEAGLPNGGSLGYELFDKQSSFGTTSFVQNINKQRALQGELARTITSLRPVRSAIVNLVLSERELFSRDSTNASASVTLELVSGERLRKEQIIGIQNLVANAVPGLSNKSVTILDSQANILASGDEETEGFGNAGGSLRSEELRLATERRLKKAIENILSSVVGRSGVRAEVSVDLDFDRVTTNSETFDPEGQVARSVQSSNEEITERDPGPEPVTVENNLPGLAGDFDVDAAPTGQTTRNEEVTNFEISKTIQSVISESGEINRLSIGVNVDGVYTTDADGNKTYSARSENEMEQISALVRSAVGFDANRGDTLEITNIRFIREDVPTIIDDSRLFGIEKSKLLETVEMLVAGIMVLLVLLLIVKPMITHLLTSGQNEEEDEIDPVEALLEAQKQPALAGPNGSTSAGQAGGDDDALLDMQAIEGKVKASTAKKVGDIVTNHPNETVSVIRNWMSQEQ